MSQLAKLFAATAAIAIVFCGTSETEAHSAFKKQMGKKYANMKINCNACHVAKKPKTERGEFGKLFYAELQKTTPKLTADWKAKKGAEKKNYEKTVMVPAFDKALKIVAAKTNDKKETYDDLIKAGKIEGITVKPPKK